MRVGEGRGSPCVGLPASSQQDQVYHRSRTQGKQIAEGFSRQAGNPEAHEPGPPSAAMTAQTLCSGH